MAAACCWSASHCSGSQKLDEFLLARAFPVSSHPIHLQRAIRIHIHCSRGSIRLSNSIKGFPGIRFQSTEAEYVHVSVQEREENISKATLLWRAIKLPMYSVALIPLTVGSAAAYWQTGLYNGKRYLTLLVSSILVIAWLNLSNDVHDFDKGADRNKKESVVNLIGSRTGTFIAACLLLAFGLVGLTWMSVEAGSLRSVLLLLSAIFCGFIYQCPPFRLGYIGLGEPLCFVAFGPFATTAFYFLQSGIRDRELSLSSTAFCSSILVGITTTLILFCSHFHQVEDDEESGKYSPLVRLGTKTGAKLVKMAVMTLYSLLFVLGIARILPSSCIILGALTLPIGNLVSTFVEKNHKDKSSIFMAKYYCVRLHAVFGIAIAAGLVSAKLFARKSLPQAIIL